MSMEDPTLDSYPKGSEVTLPLRAPAGAAKPQRVLACVLCQQRKIKCDRKFPCGRQRRRRFPERELLERLRHYEALLRQNNIKFEPLHPSAVDESSPSEVGERIHSPGDERSERVTDEAGLSDGTSKEASTPSETVNYWHALNQKGQDAKDNEDNDSDSSEDDDIHEGTIKKAWDHFRDNHSNLLFGSRATDMDLSTLHPSQVHIFKLWQIYLENVNPLLKVTHTPTLQARIIDAAGNVTNISPTLEALMFSIYCATILSLADEECRMKFGSSREELLTRYQFGCLAPDGIALALTVFEVSIKPDTDPRSLSSMLSVALRIAQRMGIHSEASYDRCNVLEAEMRRRLWWSLIAFDNRICEMSMNHKSTMLVPTWDCRTPLNVNDFEIWPEMKKPPVAHEQPTEALFPVVRSELADLVRGADFHLDFTNPYLKRMARGGQHGRLPGRELDILEKLIEEKRLRDCNPENPLHFMTLWTARTHLAQYRLLEHYSHHSRPSAQLTDTQRDAAVSHALRLLECNTELISSPLTKGYLWYVRSYFPFPAYIHVVQDLRKRPLQPLASKAWEVMSENWSADEDQDAHDDEDEDKERVNGGRHPGNPFFAMFSRIVLLAWEAREREMEKMREGDGMQRGFPGSSEIPRIVSDIKRKVTPAVFNVKPGRNPTMGVEQPNTGPVTDMDMNIDDFISTLMPMPMDFGTQDLLYSLDTQADPAALVTGATTWDYSGPLAQATVGFDMNQVDWDTMG